MSEQIKVDKGDKIQEAAKAAIENRSESDIINQVGFEVILGGESHHVNLLNIKEASAWRKKYAEYAKETVVSASVTSENLDEYKRALDTLVVAMPDAAVGLVFDYAKKLDREKLEETANDYEIAMALRKIIGFAFPSIAAMTSGPTVQMPMDKKAAT